MPLRHNLARISEYPSYLSKGNIFLTGNDYGTARDWARLGLLYLRDGVWEGKRVLPEGFAEFVSTPAPAWKQPVYGGLFWLNRTGTWNLPKDAYYMSGEGGKVFIVPSLDLVVVRMGHERGEERGLKILNSALGELRTAIRLKQTEKPATSEKGSQHQYRATPQQVANVH